MNKNQRKWLIISIVIIIILALGLGLGLGLGLKKTDTYDHFIQPLGLKKTDTYDHFIQPSILAPSFPQKLFLTYRSSRDVPEKVWNNLARYAPNYQISFFDDKEADAYIRTNFPPAYINRYRAFRLGAHRADFFRYLVLFREGGLYFDIKIVPVVNVDTAFPDPTKKLHCSWKR